MRSQDVLHSAYIPYAEHKWIAFLVTQFAFEPIYTTDEYRELPFMVELL
jgi:cytochrome c oxidase subunit 2